MRANCWAGRNKVEVRDVPDPTIVDPGDAVVRVTSTAVCGSDLHLYDGYVPTMRDGDVLGHEFMGEVVETGPEVTRLKVGDRVVVPFPISCGACHSCRTGLYSLCENSNPNAGLAEKLWGHATGGIFGYSHLTGGYAGGQAEYVRVPFADVGPLKVPDGISDDSLLMLADVFPTAWMAAEMCDVEPGDVVAVWGAGPVGLLAASSAYLMGAERVVVIDQVEHRLELARRRAGAETIDFTETDVHQALLEKTGGRGPDACIDAVGMEADHGMPLVNAYDRVKQATRQETDRAHVLRQAITACRNGGTVSIVGVYGGFVDKFPIGSMMNRSLTVRTGQCHAHRYLEPLLGRVESGQVDPSYVVSHHMPLDAAPQAYETFKHKQDDCVKVVLTP